jgi:hypothetical protein
MLQKTSLVAALISMSAAACGGGGSDTAVSASPAAQSPVAAFSTAMAASTATTPAAPEASARAPSVSGPLVWAALQTGVSADPHPDNPYTNYRKVMTAENTYYFLGDALVSHSMGSGFAGASGIGITGLVSVEPVANDGVIVAVKANGLTLEGAPLDLRNVNPAIDAAAGTWTSGEWFATLLLQSVANRPDLMRVCWDTQLPPPEPVTGPPGFSPVVREAPFKRLMCGVYSNSQPGPDVGGYVVDDFNGTVTTFSGTW